MVKSIFAAIAGALTLTIPCASTSFAQQTGSELITPRDLIEIVDIAAGQRSFVLSADGTRLAYQLQQASLRSNTYSLQWRIRSLSTGDETTIDAGEPERIAFETRINGGIAPTIGEFSPNSRYFAYLRKASDQRQLWVLNLETRRNIQITRISAEIIDFRWLSDDDIVFSTGRSNEEIQRARDEMVRDGFRFDGAYDPGYSIFPMRLPETATEAQVVSIRTRRIQDASPAERNGLLNPGDTSDNEAASFPGPRARNVLRSEFGFAWFEPLDEARQGDAPPRTLRFTNASEPRVAQTCRHPECTGQLEELWRSTDGRHIYFSKYAEQNRSRSKILVLDTLTGDVREIVNTSDLVTNCRLGDTALFCLYESYFHPAIIAQVSLESGVITTLVDPNPHFARFASPRVERVATGQESDTPGFVDIVYPIDFVPGRQYPAVVVQYWSRGFLRGGVGNEYPIRLFAQAGFIVLSVDRAEPRALLERQSALEVAIASELDQTEYTMRSEQLREVIQYVDAQGVLDRSRIGITGLSDGGEAVIYELMHGDAFATGISSWVVADPIAFYIVSSDFRQLQRRTWGYEGPDTQSPAWQRWWRSVSPSINHQGLEEPLLLNLADTEVITATQFMSVVDVEGLPVEAWVYPNEHHVKDVPSHRLAIYQRNVAWMQFWLQGIETSAIAEETFVRWRAIRAATCTRQGGVPSYCDQ